MNADFLAARTAVVISDKVDSMFVLMVRLLKSRSSGVGLMLCWWFCCHACGLAQDFDEQFDHWPVDLKVNGNVLVAGDIVDLPIAVELCEVFSGGKPARKIDCLLIHRHAPATDRLRELETAYGLCFAEVTSVPIAELPDLPTADMPAVIAWQVDTPAHADPSSGESPGSTGELEAAYEFLATQLNAGKTIVACGTAAEMGEFVIDSARKKLRPGANALPNCILQTEFDGSEAALLAALEAHPRCVGVGLEAGTALGLSGRKVIVAGDGQATFVLRGNRRQNPRVESISARRDSARSPTEWMIDLTEWRRDAIDRTLDVFPALEPRVPHVANGTLVIAGGGRLPPGLIQRFIDLAGGVERARLVFIPCAEEDWVSPRQSMLELWRSMGVANPIMVHTKDRQRANQDESILAPLRNATGIWFGGGRQWNFADSYYGTTAHQLMKQVLKNGGVVGGSSAGASIQARYLARATPIQNLRIMAPGYERGGLGFLSGVAIDQHFSQRARQADMAELVERYPQLLGIGIDEETAIVVRKSVAEIVGAGQVYFYDRRPGVPTDDASNFQSFGAGHYFDLAHRCEIQQPREFLSAPAISAENETDEN